MTDTEHDWRHGWVPLTMRAALLKAHGNHAAAEALLQHRRDRAAGGFVTPLHAAAAAHEERRALRSMTDDDLTAAMGADDVSDEELDTLVGELDRRDKAARKAAASRAHRARRRGARDAAREADYDARTAAGESPEAAYAAAYGVSEERARRDEVIASLRSTGYKGRGLKELTRAAFRDHTEAVYLAAEDATRGHMVNKAGQAAGVTGRELLTGPEARARAYASRELLDFWQTNGRLTAADFEAGLLGGHMAHKGAAAWS